MPSIEFSPQELYEIYSRPRLCIAKLISWLVAENLYSIFADVCISISFQQWLWQHLYPLHDGYLILKLSCLVSPFHLATPLASSPFSLPNLCFLLPTPLCNHNLILSDQFPTKTTSSHNKHTCSHTHTHTFNPVSKHKSIETQKEPTPASVLITILPAKRWFLVTSWLHTCIHRQNMLIQLH